MVVASVFDETMARNFGRCSMGRIPSVTRSVEAHVVSWPAAAPRHGELVLRSWVRREGVEHPGNMQGNTRAHQHVAHTRQHGSVDRGQVRHLHLFEEVDAYRVLMALACEKDFNKIAHHAQFNELARVLR